MIKIEMRAAVLLCHVRGLLLKSYLILHGCKVGAGLKCRGFPHFRLPPSGNIEIGDYVTLGRYVTFDPGKSGKIVLGDYVNFSQNIIISSNSEVRLGDYTLVAENVSIRDGEHGIASDKLIRDQATVVEKIYIGRDVWICAGCIILKGSTIANGSIIGANSVVTRRSEIKENGIYVGTPVKYKSSRK